MSTPPGCRTELEENLWHQIILLRHRLEQIEKAVAIRDELIDLLREKVAAKPRTVTLRPPKLVAAKPVPPVRPKPQGCCQFPPCRQSVVSNRKYCSHAHAKAHWWLIKRAGPLNAQVSP